MATESATTAAALPDDVLAGILRRLPLRSLAVSRCVCKSWRAAMDEHQLLLPRSVRGLFINYGNHCYLRRSHFFARPAVAVDDGPMIDGKFSFIDPDKLSVVEFVDHCNGLILFFRPLDQAMYVCNPATQRWARLPPHPAGTLRRGRRRPPCSGEDPCVSRRRAFLVFDPAVSPHYTVMLAPDELTRDEAKGNHMEWPPSPWMWHEFSSRSGRWEEKVFVREGEAAGTVQGLLFDSFGYAFNPKWRYAAYWQGELYVDCVANMLSLLNNKYQVIKTPIDLEERNKDVRSYLGRSENGVYFAAIDGMDTLWVWILGEYGDEMEWVPKHQVNLNARSWWLHEQRYDKLKYDEPWILDKYNKEKYRKVSAQRKVCWDSDEDDIIDASDDKEEEIYSGSVKILGFHPFKEVIFLCNKDSAVACHMNSSKVQYLGLTGLEGLYDSDERESFVYTPCLIGD
ncbi:hypothetical protein HU200_049135 [Digitaria exilis]|uniref:F-box domain-containing protein n=1 Tax=Digitaria exilis TaxID=1010633 RepID=A0A835AWN1_9POAL|nr:hypothetical protein HU200_049135 [Digitaria exilis]